MCAVIVESGLVIRGGVFNLDGSEYIIDDATVTFNGGHDEDSDTDEDKHDYTSLVSPHIPHNLLTTATRLGQNLAQKLLDKGAKSILQQVQSNK